MNKTVKCVNNKDGQYAVTVNNGYDVLKEQGDYFFLRNDKNHVVKYSKKLFTEEIGTVPTNTGPIAAQRVRRQQPLTEQQMIDLIIVGDDGVVTLQTPNREEVRFASDITYTGNGDQLAISCGIGEIVGLNATAENLDNFMNENFEEDFIPLRKAIFKALLEREMSLSTDKGILLASTNTNGIDIIYLDVLDELSSNRSAVVINANSGNPIKLWMFYVNQG